jgi:hypothetical protein
MISEISLSVRQKQWQLQNKQQLGIVSAQTINMMITDL